MIVIFLEDGKLSVHQKKVPNHYHELSYTIWKKKVWNSDLTHFWRMSRNDKLSKIKPPLPNFAFDTRRRRLGYRQISSICHVHLGKHVQGCFYCSQPHSLTAWLPRQPRQIRQERHAFQAVRQLSSGIAESREKKKSIEGYIPSGHPILHSWKYIDQFTIGSVGLTLYI